MSLILFSVCCCVDGNLYPSLGSMALVRLGCTLSSKHRDCTCAGRVRSWRFPCLPTLPWLISSPPRPQCVQPAASDRSVSAAREEFEHPCLYAALQNPSIALTICLWVTSPAVCCLLAAVPAFLFASPVPTRSGRHCCLSLVQVRSHLLTSF